MDILIIEDDGLVAASLQSLLESQGTHTVRVVTGAGDAIASARAAPPDVIVADVALTASRSDTEGLDAVAAIREFTVSICIIMSGNPLPEEFARCMGDRFLRKPFRVADLLRMIEAAADDSRRSSAAVASGALVVGSGGAGQGEHAGGQSEVTSS